MLQPQARRWAPQHPLSLVLPSLCRLFAPGFPIPKAGPVCGLRWLAARTQGVKAKRMPRVFVGVRDRSRCTEMSGRHERSLRTLRCGGGCQQGRFCSRWCQKQAWPEHPLGALGPAAL